MARHAWFPKGHNGSFYRAPTRTGQLTTAHRREYAGALTLTSCTRAHQWGHTFVPAWPRNRRVIAAARPRGPGPSSPVPASLPLAGRASSMGGGNARRPTACHRVGTGSKTGLVPPKRAWRWMDPRTDRGSPAHSQSESTGLRPAGPDSEPQAEREQRPPSPPPGRSRLPGCPTIPPTPSPMDSRGCRRTWRRGGSEVGGWKGVCVGGRT